MRSRWWSLVSLAALAAVLLDVAEALARDIRVLVRGVGGGRSRSPRASLAALLLVAALAIPARGEAEPQPVTTSATGSPDAGQLVTCGTTTPDGAGTGSAGCASQIIELGSGTAGLPERMHVVADASGDGPLDIVRTYWGSVLVTRAVAARMRRDPDVAKRGPSNSAIRAGEAQLVCVELAEGPLADDTINLATDVGVDPARRTPTFFGDPSPQFANVRDIYTLRIDAEGRPHAYSSDMATGAPYEGRRPFAAWVEGTKVFFLIPAEGLGPDFRPVTYRPGDPGGFDAAGLGADPGLVATDGSFDWFPDCVDQFLVHEPLILDGEQVAPSTVWVVVGFLGSSLDTVYLRPFQDSAKDPTGLAPGRIALSVIDGGEPQAQIQPLAIWLEEDTLNLRFPVGVAKDGYHAVTEAVAAPTGLSALDAVVGAAVRVLGRWLNPIDVGQKSGDMQGPGTCGSLRPR